MHMCVSIRSVGVYVDARSACMPSHSVGRRHWRRIRVCTVNSLPGPMRRICLGSHRGMSAFAGETALCRHRVTLHLHAEHDSPTLRAQRVNKSQECGLFTHSTVHCRHRSARRRPGYVFQRVVGAYFPSQNLPRSKVVFIPA